eukprot:9472494-Pyramimonas_sp.AAC.2
MFDDWGPHEGAAAPWLFCRRCPRSNRGDGGEARTFFQRLTQVRRGTFVPSWRLIKTTGPLTSFFAQPSRRS